MNLKHLNDECLLAETQRLVGRERDLLTVILHHLREIERRRLYVGCPSLFIYATTVLGYSSDQAYRRIAAMRLIQELPAVEPLIQSGQINLTHVGLAQSLFSGERKNGTPLTPATKMEVFATMAGQSSREAQRTIGNFTTGAVKVRESVRPVGEGRNAVTVELSDEVLAKLERLKGLLAHQAPHLSTAELIDRLSDLALEKLDPAREPSRKTDPTSRAAIRRAVWRRDRHACVRCGSTYAVEEDHVTPRALGGGDALENLRLLCRTCNQRAGIERLGLAKMTPHLSRRRETV